MSTATRWPRTWPKWSCACSASPRTTPTRSLGAPCPTTPDPGREVDYAALTMDDLAPRARASKATFYRRWQGKLRLVAAALRHHSPGESDAPDTGSLASDLHALGRRAGGATLQENVMLLRALSRAMHAHPELADAMYESRIRPELETVRAVVDRAVDRGEVAAKNPALTFLPHLI
ncbi:TetR-like C-terminal domain-containing protein [Streptomyces chryseus]